MPTGGYKINNSEGIHFVSFAVVEWVDVFSRKEYRDILLESIQYCQKEKGLLLYSWCIMSNHVHLVVASKDHNTSDILRDFKKFTSKQIIQAIKDNLQESRRTWMLAIFEKAGKENSRNTDYQFWRQDNQPKELFSFPFMKQKLDYIHNNPVEAGIVENATEYLYSSARDYAGIKGAINGRVINVKSLIRSCKLRTAHTGAISGRLKRAVKNIQHLL